jgi:hypothetical protein
MNICQATLLLNLQDVDLCVAARKAYAPDMSALSNFVSLHPYFKAHSGKLDAVKAETTADYADSTDRQKASKKLMVES